MGQVAGDGNQAIVGCGEGGGGSRLGWSGGAQVDKRRTSGEIIEDVGWEPNIGCIEEDNPLCWGIPSDCAFLSRDLHLQPPRLTELHEIAD